MFMKITIDYGNTIEPYDVERSEKIKQFLIRNNIKFELREIHAGKNETGINKQDFLFAEYIPHVECYRIFNEKGTVAYSSDLESARERSIELGYKGILFYG